MKPVFYLGAQIDIGRIDPMKGPGFFSSLSFKAGIPGDSGLMKDRDWMSVENTELTHFSSHTNETCEFYWLDIAAGVSLPVKSYFYIKPFLSGSWMRFSFEGRDGYGKYARVKSSNPYTYYPIDDDPYPYLFKGAVIRYTQDWFVLATGFIIGIKLPDNLSFDMSFQISPLTFCAATDEHLTTKTTYRDITSLGLFLEPAGRLTYTINHLELSLEYAYRYIGRTRGKTYQKYKDGDYAANGEGGAGLSLSNTRFLVKVRL
jgi:outer membrane protease